MGTRADSAAVVKKKIQDALSHNRKLYVIVLFVAHPLMLFTLDLRQELINTDRMVSGGLEIVKLTLGRSRMLLNAIHQ